MKKADIVEKGSKYTDAVWHRRVPALRTSLTVRWRHPTAVPRLTIIRLQFYNKSRTVVVGDKENCENERANQATKRIVNVDMSIFICPVSACIDL